MFSLTSVMISVLLRPSTSIEPRRESLREMIGIDRANKTLRQVRSAWVKEQRVNVSRDGGIEFQANILVTFVLED